KCPFNPYGSILGCLCTVKAQYNSALLSKIADPPSLPQTARSSSKPSEALGRRLRIWSGQGNPSLSVWYPKSSLVRADCRIVGYLWDTHKLLEPHLKTVMSASIMGNVAPLSSQRHSRSAALRSRCKSSQVLMQNHAKRVSTRTYGLSVGE
ncbi:hypothetical protein CPB85DRAFT_1269587, partial [Mucidula mucida]